MFTKVFETSHIHYSVNVKQESFSALSRYHNSLFGLAFVRKLGLQEPEGICKLIKHDGVIKSQCEKPINPPPAVDTPSVDHVRKDGTDEKASVEDYVDVSILNPAQRARCVITPPSISHPVSSTGLNLDATYQSASAFIEEEMGMTDTEIP